MTGLTPHDEFLAGLITDPTLSQVAKTAHLREKDFPWCTGHRGTFYIAMKGQKAIQEAYESTSKGMTVDMLRELRALDVDISPDRATVLAKQIKADAARRRALGRNGPLDLSIAPDLNATHLKEGLDAVRVSIDGAEPWTPPNPFRANGVIEQIPDGSRKNPEQNTSRIKLIPFNSLKPATEAEYLIKDLFPRGGLILVWGPPKSGKSFWVMDAMLHVALGWEYRDRTVHKGAVVYCAFEGHSGYGKRAAAFRLHNLSDHHKPVPFYLVAAPMNFVAGHRDLMAAIRAQLGNDAKPAAVVLDTLNRSLVGSESDDKDLGAYMKAADAIRDTFGCAVIIVHHCGLDASRPRGHTSLTGAIDSQIAVKRLHTGGIIAKVELMKDGEQGETVVSRLEVVNVGTDTEGAPVTSCVVLSVEKAADSGKVKPAAVTKAAQAALQALRNALDETGQAAPASSDIPRTTQVTTVEQWREYAYRGGISASKKPRALQAAFQRAVDCLIELGVVVKRDGLVWLAQ